MPNGSLDQHLYGGPDKPILTWDRRYNIITGVASALQYLHNEYDQMVVHRDLKASNVMLDTAFNARLGDFGLARALETDKTSFAELEVQGNYCSLVSLLIFLVCKSCTLLLVQISSGSLTYPTCSRASIMLERLISIKLMLLAQVDALHFRDSHNIISKAFFDFI